MLRKVADLLEQRLEEFALAESKDQGKPVSLAKSVDIPRAITNFRFFAAEILHHEEKAHEIDGAFSYTYHAPVGVAALISPWSMLMLFVWYFI